MITSLNLLGLVFSFIGFILLAIGSTEPFCRSRGLQREGLHKFLGSLSAFDIKPFWKKKSEMRCQAIDETITIIGWSFVIGGFLAQMIAAI